MFDLKVKASKKTEGKLDELLKGIVNTVTNLEEAKHNEKDFKDQVYHNNRIEQAHVNLKNYFRLCLRNAYDLGLKVGTSDLGVTMDNEKEPTE